jgi:integrase
VPAGSTEIKGLHKSSARLAGGEIKVYWYAWKGGPRLPGEPGTPEFEAAHKAAVQRRREAPTLDTLAALVVAYRSSPEFGGLAQSTRAEWSRHLDAIQDARSPMEIGSLPTTLLADFRVKKPLFQWRDQWRSTPRKADYAFQVLSAVLSWAVARGMIATNVLLGHATLYKANRADKIWSKEEVTRFGAKAPSPEVGYIVRLACLTGLRRDDLLRLKWSDVSEVAITIRPSKSEGRRQPKEVVVPLLDETLQLLDEIREQQGHRWQMLADTAARKGRIAPLRPTTVLSNTRARPWSKDGAEHQVIDTKRKAGVDKHLHDCRGTFATRLRLEGASYTEIADVLGWAEDRVERLMAAYVDKNLVVRGFAERLRARSAARK